MFNRYWRTYPWGLQLVLFILTVFTLSSFATYLVLALVPRFSGVSINDLIQLSPASGIRSVRMALLAQAVSHAGMFALPALLFAAFTHPRLREYLGLRLPGKSVHWLLVTGIMLGFLPVSAAGEAWMLQHLHFGHWAAEMQQRNDQTFAAFLKLPSGADLAGLFFVLAFLPAFGEELIFRGIVLRLFHRGFNRRMPAITIGGGLVQPDAQISMLMPVISTALMFAFWHTNPYGFVFIFMAGCLLALIYALTGSLLCSIWAHFLYNGAQVLLYFMGQYHPPLRAMTDGDISPVLVVVGLAVFLLCFYMLVRKQTPLPADWSDDFRGELPQMQNNITE